MASGEDAAGQLADAALLGAAFEHGGGGSQHHDETCANCGAALAGRYCHMCGQRGHVHRSLLHLVEEFFHGLFHLDGKMIRTAPLLFFRPGALTKRFLEGQRVRFVSPIGMFLFTIFVMFFAVSTIEPEQVVGGSGATMSAPDRAKLKQDIADARQRAKGKGDAAVESALDNAEKAADATPTDAAPADAKPADAKPDDDGDQLFASPLGMDWRKISKDLAKKPKFFSLGGPEVEKRVRASLDDPDLLVYKLRSAASGYSFMLVPLSVPFLWLMFFWKRRVYMFDHVIFSLHSLSFMALFVTLVIVGLEGHVGGDLWLWAFLIPPVHMFFHLRGTYGLSLFSSLWRTVFLSVVALIVLTVYVFAILMLGLLH